MIKNKYTETDVELRYSNWLSMFIDLVKPKNLYLYAGRGTGKTADIIAKRSIDIVYSMPGAVISIVANTYINALTNVLPYIREGWDRNGFYEHNPPNRPGHYVIDEPPPSEWTQPFLKIKEFKKTISTFNGCIFVLKSLDSPSISAGNSVQHQIGDEGKYDNPDMLKKTNPTLRGDRIKFGHSPYFMGRTITSDIADPADGEYDWMSDMQFNMDQDRIFYTLQAALIANEIEFELFEAKKAGMHESIIQKIVTKLERWKERLNVIRMNTTLFYVASSLANIDILTFEYIITQYQTLSYEEFKKAILSCKPSVEKGRRFYTNLDDSNFYSDSYNYDGLEDFGIKEFNYNSSVLRHVIRDKPIDAGYDAGNMMSLVMGQEQGNIYRVFKFLYTLSPEWIRQLADKFIDYFTPHRNKVLNLYYDRAANNFQKAGVDYASQLKKAIEVDGSNKRTGWQVNLMSLGQGNITQGTEYNFMTILLSGKEKRLPKVLICKYECKELKSSLELAQSNTRYTSGRKIIIKVKTSEKKKLSDLPMQSTNPSDAFKYLMCRRNYLLVLKSSSSSYTMGDTSIR